MHATKPDVIAANLAAVEAHFHSEATGEVDPAVELYTEDAVWESSARGLIFGGGGATAGQHPDRATGGEGTDTAGGDPDWGDGASGRLGTLRVPDASESPRDPTPEPRYPAPAVVADRGHLPGLSAQLSGHQW